MDKFARNLTIGFVSAALLLAAGRLDPSLADTETATSRPGYEDGMEARIDDAAAEMNQLRSDAGDLTDEQVADLDAAWDDVEARWAEFQAAADENWDSARLALDEAWGEFEATWDETFSDDSAGASSD